MSSSINALSSVYAPLSAIINVSGTNDGTNWTAITIGEDTYSIPAGGGSISGYAELSVSNIFTSMNYFSAGLSVSRGNMIYLGRDAYLRQWADTTTHIIFTNTDSTVNPELGVQSDAIQLELGGAGYGWKFDPTAFYNTSASAKNIGTSAKPFDRIYVGTIYGASTSKTIDDIALLSDISALSSVYAPLSYVSGTNDGTNWTSLTIGSETYGFAGGGGGGIPSGYVSEVWTFTLSGGSTISKTMLVGE